MLGLAQEAYVPLHSSTHAGSFNILSSATRGCADTEQEALDANWNRIATEYNENFNAEVARIQAREKNLRENMKALFATAQTPEQTVKVCDVAEKWLKEEDQWDEQQEQRYQQESDREELENYHQQILDQLSDLQDKLDDLRH